MSGHTRIKELSPTPLSRRQVLALGAGSLAAVTLSSCTGGGRPSGGEPGEPPAGGWPNHVPAPVLEGAVTSTVEGVPPMYLSPISEYFQSVAEPPGDGSAISTLQILWGAPPQDAPRNEWLQELNRLLGSTYEPQLAPAASYGDRYATTLASGRLPDLMFTQDTTPQGLQAVLDGGLLDLSEVLSGEGVERWPNLANIRTETWQTSSKDGRIYGVPNENSPLSNFPTFRADALEAVGATDLGSSPQEMFDVLVEVGQLGNLHGKEMWTFGDLWNMTTVVEWMHGIGPEWQLGDDGRLRAKWQHPRYPEVMQYLRDLWDAGAVYPDPTGQQPPEMLPNGQCAFGWDSYNGYFLNPIVGQVPERTPGASLVFFVPPVAADAELTIQRDDGYWSIVGISSSVTDDARRDMLLDVLNWFRSPFGSQEYLFINSGVEGVHYTFDDDHSVSATDDATALADMQAVNWLGVSPVNGSYIIAPGLTSYAEQFYPVIEELVQATVPNPIAGLYSEVASRSDGTRWDVRNDYINGMQYGRRPTSDYDAFVEAWLAAGGQEALDDYQRVYDARQEAGDPSAPTG